MTKQKSIILKKLFHKRFFLLLISIILFWLYFSFTKTIAQENNYSIINNKSGTQINTGIIITNQNNWTISLSRFYTNTLQKYSFLRNGIETYLYDIQSSTWTIYFNNFDDSNILKQNQAAWADSIRDFSWWINLWIWQNWWRYYYISNNNIITTWINIPCQATGTRLYAWVPGNDWVWCSWNITIIPNSCDFVITPNDCDITDPECRSKDFLCQRSYLWYTLTWEKIFSWLKYSSTENFWKINNNPIEDYMFLNIWKYMAHPWSWTNNSIPQLQNKRNIPITWIWKSNINWRIKIINKIAWDENNCWNWVQYLIYKTTGDINNPAGIRANNIDLLLLRNFEKSFAETWIELSTWIFSWQHIIFEIDNNNNNNCAWVHNNIQIYDITYSTDLCSNFTGITSTPWYCTLYSAEHLTPWFTKTYTDYQQIVDEWIRNISSECVGTGVNVYICSKPDPYDATCGEIDLYWVSIQQCCNANPDNLSCETIGTSEWTTEERCCPSVEQIGEPTYTNEWKYYWALDFNGNSIFGIGNNIYPTSSWITFTAWVKTTDNTRNQWIITKNNIYWLVLKQWTIWISPSSYWIRHNTNITIENDTRTHIGWTYNGNTMKVYKNWDEVIRSANISWNITNTNISQTNIWYDITNYRWRIWSIDEPRVYWTVLNDNQIKNLYESNLKVFSSWIDSYREFINQKFWLTNDLNNYWIRANILWLPSFELTWTIIIDTTWVNYEITWYNTTNILWNNIVTNESEELIINITWLFDTGNNMISWLVSWDYSYNIDIGLDQDIEWEWLRNYTWITSTWIIHNFWREDEPIIKDIKIRINDYAWNTSYWTWTIERKNIPAIISWKYIYTWISEDVITFDQFIIIDTWSNFTYQWYEILSWNIPWKIITWEINKEYTTGKNIPYTGMYYFEVKDNQWLATWRIITGIRSIVEENIFPTINTWINLWWNQSWTIWLSSNYIIKDWDIWNCTIGSTTSYSANHTAIGNDFCIVKNNINQKLVFWRYNILINNTIFQLSWYKNNSWVYLINPKKNEFIVNIQNKNLNNFWWSISWIDNSNIKNINIYNQSLIGLYNFDRIVLADTNKDFSAIQSGKNREYMRRPRGIYTTTGYKYLNYDIESNKRVINTPWNPEELFIDRNYIYPGNLYWDAVIKRTSSTNAKIEIEYILEEYQDDDCKNGDWIKYELLHERNNNLLILDSWSYIENGNFKTSIFSWDAIYLKINRNWNNNCDTTHYSVKIYQLPETNISINNINQWINSWATYTESGKYFWGLQFSDKTFVNIGTGMYAPEMSISLWVYKEWDNPNQTIIQKRQSYGIAIINNTLQVTNKSSDNRYDTNIEIPSHTRTHIGRSHGNNIMKIFINWKESRTGNIPSTIRNSLNPTTIWYSISNGYRNWIIDEVYIYSWVINNNHFWILYEHNLNKTSENKWKRLNNSDWRNNEWTYNFNITANWQQTWWIVIRDFSWPTLERRIWMMTWSQITWESTTGIIVKENQDILLSWNIIDNIQVDTWTFQRDIDNDWTIDWTGQNIYLEYNGQFSREIKLTINDIFWNTWVITGNINRINVIAPSFSWFIMNINWNIQQELVTWDIYIYENDTSTITRTGYSQYEIKNYIREIDVWTWFIVVSSGSSNQISLPIMDEPTQWDIKVTVENIYNFKSTIQSKVERLNRWPTIPDNAPNLYTQRVEKNLIFTATWYDTGSEISYQRYTWYFCTNILSWETNETYIDIKLIAWIYWYSYNAFDKQGSWTCHNFNARRDEQNESTPIIQNIGNISTNLSWSYSWFTNILGTIEWINTQWKLWNCEIINTNTVWFNSLLIWNDFCIASVNNNLIVLWRYNINFYKTLFNILWTKKGLWEEFTITKDTSLLLEIQNNNLTWFQRNISWENISNTINIYDQNLIGLYNFDTILLADSKLDFWGLQSGKNREYMRRPRGKWNITDYQLLQFDAVSKQRIIGRPVQNFDWLFIEKDQLNPWDKYWDSVISRTSPITTDININLTIEDANTNCWDWIRYTVLNQNTIIWSWTYWTQEINTHIIKNNKIYFRINSSWNNNCDTTNYHIQIYQRPENNSAYNNKYPGYNSWVKYIQEWKYKWALEFSDQNQLIDIGTGIINTWEMSISMRIKRIWQTPKQGIIEKRWSYWISIFDNTLQVTNRTDQRRYDTKIEIPLNTRTHIGWSYGNNIMTVYINGKEKRSLWLFGSIWNTINPTIIWNSLSNWYWQWIIDEIYIYNKVINKEHFSSLYEHNLNKIWLNRRQWISNTWWSINDWLFNFSWIVNWYYSKTGTFIRDFNWPIMKDISWYTGRESQNLLITWIWYDSGNSISEYQRRRKTNNERNERITSTTGNIIVVPAENEPITWQLEIIAKDVLWYKTFRTWDISRINTWPTILNDIFDFYTKIWWNISFNIYAIDTGSNLIYQRYYWNNCTTAIPNETKSLFTTWRDVLWTINFSFKVSDNFLEPSKCTNITWSRIEATNIENVTIYLEWDGNWWIISWNRNSLIGRQWYSTTWKNIITNKSKCSFSNNKTKIIYTPEKEYKENDSCIIQLQNNEYITIWFLNIVTNFWYNRNLPNSMLINWTKDIIWSWIIYTKDINNLILNILWETAQWSGLIQKTVSWYTNNLLRKYTFDKLLITDSKRDFWIFERNEIGEHWRKYFRDNTTTTWYFTFNPRIQSWIINEPLQDYEYIQINSGQTYPWSSKYGNVIYERTSNITWNIEINTNINSANPSYCSTTDWILYSIKVGNNYNNTNTIYTKNIDNLTENSSINTSISYGQKIYFIINSNQNNQCDKIWFNTKIYLNPIHDFWIQNISIISSWITYNESGKYWWSYQFNDNSYINLWTGLNKWTWLSFSTRIKINNETKNQTLIYKKNSYWLVIKEWKIKVSTDEWRRYDTNDITTNQLTNNDRNHLIRTYDWKDMYLYINGLLTRSGKINGYYPNNSNTTYIWRSQDHWQLKWYVDEFHVRNKFITSDEAEDIYNTNFRKINANNQEFIFNQKDLSDWRYYITGTINNTNIFTGNVIIDNNPPLLETQSLYTGNEWTGIYINITGRDEWIWIISWYRYSRNINNSNPSTWSIWIIDRSTGTSIIISAQNEPTTWILKIEIKDSLEHIANKNIPLQRINNPITTNWSIWSWNETEIISFIASWFDIGWTTNTWYQRYLWTNCATIILQANEKTFSTWRNEPWIENFSYKMKDAQNLRSDCTIVTGIRNNIAPIAKDLEINWSWNQNITFFATWTDPGWTIFSYQRYNDSWCLYPITGEIYSWFTAQSRVPTTWIFSYRIRDAQWVTGLNNNRLNDCQIVTGYWPFINPIVQDFILSNNTANKLVTWDRKILSNASSRENESNSTTIANISSGYWWLCQIINHRISFIPDANKIWTGYCELKVTDNKNNISYIKAYALNIDTISPTTTIINQNNTSFKLQYTDTSTGISYYKILTGVRDKDSCWNIGYTQYISWNSISIPYMPNTKDYKTICFYSIDTHWNKENIKSELFTQPEDLIPFLVSFQSNPFMNTIFEANISSNKAFTWYISWLDSIIYLNYNGSGIYLITWNLSENTGQKIVDIFLQSYNWSIFNKSHTFMIDQISPATPIITEKEENSNYYTIKRNTIIDEWAGLKQYNYEISNEFNIIKTGATNANYLNINKDEVKTNSQISIKIQSEDLVNNKSSRSIPVWYTIITIPNTILQDTIPEQFYFTKVSNAKRDTIYTSNEIIIKWLSDNTSVLISLSTGILYINNIKIDNNSSYVKNNDIVFIQLRSSSEYNQIRHATLTSNWIWATYSITTENWLTENTSSTTSFLEQLRKIIKQLKEENPTTGTVQSTNTNIDNSRISAPHIAPNWKVYTIYKTLDGRYSSNNFIIKKYFWSLSEIKTYINKNNPK